MERCKRCGGTKRIMGMGGIQKECDVCHGIGMVTLSEVKRHEVVIPQAQQTVNGETMDIPVKIKQTTREKAL